MASANLDLVRPIYAAWERSDYSSAEWAHPGIEFVRADRPLAGSWTGLAEMAAVWGETLGAWDEHRTEAEEYRELDDGHVLVLARNSARGKTSELDLAQIRTKTATLFHVHDGKVRDRERAFTDLGLAPVRGRATSPD